MKRIILALAAAVALVAGVALPASASPARPAAHATHKIAEANVYCTFGDVFYYWTNMGTGHRQVDVYSSIYGVDVMGDGNPPPGGILMCQVATGAGGAWYEWAVKGTDDCLTWNQGYLIDDFIPCAGKASQQWALSDLLDSEYDVYEQWGEVINGLGYAPDDGWLVNIGKTDLDDIGIAWLTTKWPYYCGENDIFKACTSWELDGPVS
jgi:hypothetical protein